MRSGICGGEGEAEGEGDERVDAGEEEVGCDGGEVAPGDEVCEVERRVAARRKVLEVDGEEEGEREEGDNDQVDEANGGGWGRDGRAEGTSDRVSEF